MNNRQKTPQLPHHKNKLYSSLYLRPPAKTDFRRQKQGCPTGRSQHLAGGVATDLGEVFWKSTLCDITEDWFREIKSLGRHFVKPTEATKGRSLFRSLLMTGDISWPHKLLKQMLQDFLEGKQAGPRTRTGLKHHTHLFSWQHDSIVPLSLAATLCFSLQKILHSSVPCSLVLMRKCCPYCPQDSSSNCFLFVSQPNPCSSSTSFS